MSVTVFKRIEKKYLLDESAYARLFSRIGYELTEDKYSGSLVVSTYLDTPEHLLIRNSIDAEDYKEKLRLRTYGEDTDRAFLELKKKYHGVVFKRRVELSYSDALRYISGGAPPIDSQIMREIDYAMRIYRYPSPSCLLTYERKAYLLRGTDVRITFDRNVRYRMDEPLITHGSHGTPILGEGEVLMEIKSGGAVPMWLAHVLSEEHIFPNKFSKYGRAYINYLKEKNK